MLATYVCNYPGCLFQSNDRTTIRSHFQRIHDTPYTPTEVKKPVVENLQPYLIQLGWKYSCTKCNDLFPTKHSRKSHINAAHSTKSKVQKVAVPQSSSNSGKNGQAIAPAIKPAAAQTTKAQEEGYLN